LTYRFSKVQYPAKLASIQLTSTFQVMSNFLIENIQK